VLGLLEVGLLGARHLLGATALLVAIVSAVVVFIATVGSGDTALVTAGELQFGAAVIGVSLLVAPVGTVVVAVVDKDGRHAEAIGALKPGRAVTTSAPLVCKCLTVEHLLFKK